MIAKIIRGITVFIVFMVLAHSQLSFADPHIQINSHAEYANGGLISEKVVNYIITDPQGWRVGYDPRTDNEYSEFEEGGYGTTGIDNIYSVEAGIKPIDGSYTIEIIGDELMAFSISFSIYREIKGEGFAPDMVVQGLTDKGLTSKFEMTYNSDPTKPSGSVVRVATPSSLKQDIALSRKIGWIDNDGIMMSLYKKAEAIEKSISRGDKGTAKNQLEALINELNAQKGKHINDEAVKMLLEDTQYMIEHL